MSTQGKKEETTPMATGAIMEDLTKKQAFKKFSYRGLDINAMLGLNMDKLA